MKKSSKFLVGLGSSVALLATPIIGCSSGPDTVDDDPIEAEVHEVEEAEAECGAEADCGAAEEEDAEASCGAEGDCGAAEEDEEGADAEQADEGEGGCGAEGGCGS